MEVNSDNGWIATEYTKFFGGYKAVVRVDDDGDCWPILWDLAKYDCDDYSDQIYPVDGQRWFSSFELAIQWCDQEVLRLTAAGGVSAAEAGAVDVDANGAPV